MVEKSLLSHVGSDGQTPHMVDIGQKATTEREAVAQAVMVFPSEVMAQLRAGQFMTRKGAVLTIAQLAGIMGAKMTAQLIPLCHPLALNSSAVELDVQGDNVVIICRVSCTGRTGVEMEALTGASIAALTLYDMCKALSHDMIIREIKLMGKSGGKRDFTR